MLASAVTFGFLAVPAAGDGNVDLPAEGLLPELSGVCAETVSGATGMVEDGTGAITDFDVPGDPLLTVLEWSGTDHIDTAEVGTSSLDFAVNGGAPSSVEGQKVPDPAGTAQTPDDTLIHSWVADVTEHVDAAGEYKIDLSGWDAEPWYGEGAGSWGATLTSVYELPGPCEDPVDISWRGGVDLYFGGRDAAAEARWGDGTPGEGHVTDVLKFAVPEADEERVLTVQFSGGGIAKAGRDASGEVVCREANLWYAAGAGEAPTPDDDLVRFDNWGEPIVPADPGAVEIVRQPFGYPGCEPEINPTDRLTETNPDRADGHGDTWVVQEEGHPCAEPTTCPYRAEAIRPSTGGFVGRDWGLAQVDITVPAGATWLAFQFESPTDALARTGSLEESGGWSGHFLVKAPSGEPPEEPEVGSLEIVKTLSGDVEGHQPGTTFDVEVDCSDDAFDTELDLKPNVASVIADIPVGTECHVAETEVPDPQEGFEYGEPTYDPGQDVSIDEKGASVAVVVDNPLRQLPPSTTPPTDEPTTTPEPSSPPSEPEPTSPPSEPETTSPPSEPELPDTGVDVAGTIGWVGAFFVLAGLAMATRRWILAR